MPGEMGSDSRCSSCPKPATQGGGYINRWKAGPSLRAALKESDGALLQQVTETQSQRASPFEVRVCTRMGCGETIPPSFPPSVTLCDQCLPIARKAAEESLAKLQDKRRASSSSSTPPCRPPPISIPSVPDIPTVAIHRRILPAPPPIVKVESDVQDATDEMDLDESLELEYPDEDVEMKVEPPTEKQETAVALCSAPLSVDEKEVSIPLPPPPILPRPPPMQSLTKPPPVIQPPPMLMPQSGSSPAAMFMPAQMLRPCVNSIKGCRGIVQPGSMARRCMSCVSADWQRMRAARPIARPAAVSATATVAAPRAEPVPIPKPGPSAPQPLQQTATEIEQPSAKRKKVTWADLEESDDEPLALSSNRSKGKQPERQIELSSPPACSSSSSPSGPAIKIPPTPPPATDSDSDSDTPLSTRAANGASPPRPAGRGRVLSWPPPGQHAPSESEDSDVEVPLSSIARTKPGPLSKTGPAAAKTKPPLFSKTRSLVLKLGKPGSASAKPPSSAADPSGISPSSESPPSPTKAASSSPSSPTVKRPSIPLPRRRVSAPLAPASPCPKQANSALAQATSSASTAQPSTPAAISSSTAMSSSSGSAQAPIDAPSSAIPASSFAPLQLPAISHPIPKIQPSSTTTSPERPAAVDHDSDSDLTDLSDLEAALLSDDSDDEPSAQRLTGLKIRIPARPPPESVPAPAPIAGPTKPCRICKQSMPLENRWKCCEACRERTRLYQRARQNGEVEPQRRNLNAELAAVDRILGDASRVVVGSRKCTMRFCMHILPPAGEYKYKMCASCRSYVRSTKKATHGGKENGVEEHPKKQFRAEDNERLEPTPPGRCVSLDCGMVVSPPATKCEQCTFRDEHPGQPRKMESVYQQRKMKQHLPPPRLPTPYPEFPTFMLLLVEFYTRLRDFLETQARYLVLSNMAGRHHESPSMFAFDGEYSVIAMDYDVLGRKEAVVQHARVLKDEIECAGRLKFGPTMWVSQVEHGVVARFACDHEVLIHVAATGEKDQQAAAPLHKIMRGELEIAIMADGSHRFFPGQRTVIRFRLVG
ncbi:uncharacterized protein SCHCODRAFT_02674508 [Schizophyllum commune H4-8]|nr:uncharacterized protein SCHCODRAFT_02674508 [Schizophyllum commune H4-8]KAI5899842.1 hypothetical protein SCHCODRAFT_02674508 [Schizophyllum commune H4-8]